MSARKRTPINLKPSAVPNTRKLSESTINMTIAEPVIVDPSHSQKYMQHKLDMAYNKYIQNLALENILTKIHKGAERSYDDELAQYEEIHEVAVGELEGQQEYVLDVSAAMENDYKLKFLESTLDDIYTFMTEKEILQKVDKINDNLQLICDNLNFKNITFETTDENYTKLQNVLREMAELLEEINEGNNEDFNLFVENILKSKELITKLRKNQEHVTTSLSKLNKLVLKTASLQLSKTDELNTDITPI